MRNNYNPDVLNCLANLSNDEVFTPTSIVNAILDMLPDSLWKDKNAKFLDPCTKTGVFLREIVKRLNEGLKEEIPDEQTRINHILKNQIYGIAITELTGLVSRRSIYCSKHANGKYSTCEEFEDENGNIKFTAMKHTWSFGNCIFCGANKGMYDRPEELESHAYEFIHVKNPKEVFDMKFDVIIGNPPYQLNTGGAQAQAIPLYNKFVEQAKKLQPRYLCMIIPSRWFTGGFGLDSFRKSMLEDKSIRVIHDFLNASDCFPGVDIKGGVCYFLWDRDNKGKCKIITHKDDTIVSEMERNLLEDNLDVFIRYNQAVPIYQKISKFKEESLTTIISSQRPFGLPTNFKDFPEEKRAVDDMKVYANKKVGFIAHNHPIMKNAELIDKYKVLTPKAIGSGESQVDWVKPILAEPNSVCTETYIVLGAFDDEEQAKNLISYTQTKFFHFLLTLKKNTQDALSKAYMMIPLQDFNESWNDEKLYKKYNLTEEDINFIESMVRPEIGVSTE